MSPFWKDIFREIKNTSGRFISLIIITLLGATSVVGIPATAIDMRDIADKFYKEHNLFDLQLKSTIGFNDDDVDGIRNTKNIKEAMPTHTYDVFVEMSGAAFTSRVFALPDKLNSIDITEGRLPETENECVVEKRLMDKGSFKIGDKLKLKLDDMEEYNNILRTQDFTITGVVSSPIFIADERGTTTLGEGNLGYFLYVNSSAFALDFYTDVYVQMQESTEIYNLSDEYYNLVDETKIELEKTSVERLVLRKDEFTENQKEIDEGWIEYSNSLQEFNKGIADGKSVLENSKIELDKADSEINAAQSEIDSSREQISQSNLQGAALTQAEAQLNQSQAVIDAQKTEYEKALEEYNKGLEELDKQEKDGLAELEEAKKEMQDSQAKLDKASDPEWFFLTRKDGVAFDSYHQDTIRIEKIGYVFPTVFFLVAMLVSLTTMSRMVEDQRTQIGIYKALGYKPGSIVLKFLFYAISSGAIGGLIGTVIGSKFFPVFITKAYSALYNLPPVEKPIPVLISVIAILIAVASVASVTIITYFGAMKGEPSLLMRPKSPKAGKRVLLEKFPSIWEKIGFIEKVTFRNIFRYKRRFFMTLAGIIGCTALLVTAFGLSDSVGSVSDLQYESIVKFNEMIVTKEIKNEEQYNEIKALLPEKHIFVREISVNASNDGKGFTSIVVVPEDVKEFQNYINLTPPKEKAEQEYTDKSVIITDKLAKTMGVSIGDEFSISLSDGRELKTNVTGIAENYVLHYIYLSPEIYTELFKEKPLFNTVFAFSDNTDFSENALKNENVRAIVHLSDSQKNLSKSTNAMGIVTIVLLVLACALAFVVLFNLTNINISERIRELATIKVLGFQDPELSMYVYRENALVTILGILIGLIAGNFLEEFMISAIEVDLLKFPLVINPLSYVLSVVFAISFSAFVNWVMNFKLAKIDMVESLKSVE